MSNKTNTNGNKQKSSVINTKRLIAAAAITITVGGAAGFLVEQMSAPAEVATAQADAAGITVVYMTPLPTATSTSALVQATAPAIEPTLEPTVAATSTTEPTVEPTAESTAMPTLEPTSTPAPVATQPVFVAQSRSSR